MLGIRKLALTVLVITLSSMVAAPALAEQPFACPDYRIYGVAGTNGVQADLLSDDPKLLGETTRQTALEIQRLLELEDFTVDMRGLDYPATGLPYSVGDGLRGLYELIDDFVEDCPSTWLILTGYSQGGDVVGSYAQTEVSILNLKRDRIAGVVLLGDPRFNSADGWANSGTYSEERGGDLLFTVDNRSLFEPLVVDTEADPPLDMAVVSMCRAWDRFCQGSKVRPFLWDDRFYAPDRDAITRHNPPGNENYEHESYKPDDVKAAACELVTKMGFDVCDPAVVERDPLDVVFLIDTTVGGFANVEELQSRAAEFVNDATHDAATTHYAVISYGQGSVVNETDGFTDDDTLAVERIEELESTAGTYGSLYSAISLANDLDWREDARKVTMTLSTSRTCPSQYCATEYGALGESASLLLMDAGLEGHTSGAYTRDNDWFFERPGWSSAFWGGASRLGGAATPQENINGLHDVYVGALTADLSPSDPIVGSESLVAGQSGTFRADSIVPFYVDSPPRRFVWSFERTDDIGPRSETGAPGGGGGVEINMVSTTAVAAESALSAPPAALSSAEGEEPAETLPEDQGPVFRPVFEEPGVYTVTVTAYVDGGTREYSQLVRVYETPTVAPAAPLVESHVDGDEQVFHWYAGDGEFAPAYVFFDEDGVAVDSTDVETTLSQIRPGEFERRVALRDPADRYTLSAWNEVGLTPATPLVTATTATYAHAVLDDGIPSGGTLELSGTSSVEIAALLEDAPEFDGDYVASLRSPRGDAVDVDMLTATADATDGDEWGLTMQLRDAMTPDGGSVTDMLEDGFDEELLLGGTVQVHADGVPVDIRIDPTGEIDLIDEYVIEAGVTPPAGVPASAITVDPQAPSLQLSSDDADNLPFVEESTDPLGDWSQATITDVRTWIGTTEVTHTLTGAGISVTGAGGPTDAVIDFDGRVVGGSGNLTRDFLQNGTISFVVNGATPTVLTFAMSGQEAQELYPDLDPPRLVGRSTIALTQYREAASWSPVLDWGDGEEGAVTVEGTLPLGLTWDEWSHALWGTAEESGTFPIQLTAHGDYGAATKSYNVVVGSPSAVAQSPVGHTWISDYQDGAGIDLVDVYIAGGGYFRADNPAFSTTFPVWDAFQQSGHLFGNVDDVAFYDPDGEPLPVDGEATLEIWSGSPDWFTIQATLHRTDATAGAFSDLVAARGWITFTYDGGATNTVSFVPAN
ncbi:MAG: hypothetical protein DI566_03830 [Microbacterium sp.]|nr:MAG: hypothetical protein DI566_03830 [Microbacterium sp.]